MVVLVIDNAPENIRGELSRWFLEAKPNVFVGVLSALIREKLWEKVIEYNVKGALMIYKTTTEQGFDILLHGEPKRSLIDLDGIKLIFKENI